MVPPPLPLTRRQTDALRAVENHVQTHGWAPTYAELADLIGAASTTSAVRLVEHLESKGWIDVEPGTARGIRVIHSLETEAPSDARDHDPRQVGEGDEVWIPRHQVPDNVDLYLTRVPDNGMVSCGILIGDHVVWYAVPVPLVRNGDLVVCPVHDRRTIRRARCVGNDILLVPDDALYATSRYNASEGPLGKPTTLQRTWPADITIRR